MDALKKTTELLNENLTNSENVINELNEKIADMKNKIEIYECKICYSKTVSTILLPCKHSFCSVCAQHCEDERERKCAMCNQRFRSMIKIMGIDESDTNALIEMEENPIDEENIAAARQNNNNQNNADEESSNRVAEGNENGGQGGNNNDGNDAFVRVEEL